MTATPPDEEPGPFIPDDLSTSVTSPNDESLKDQPAPGSERFPLAEAVYQLWWRWGDFELIILDPILTTFDPPVWHQPEPIQNSQELEFVYPILDYGNRLMTSKQDELFSAGLSMCKMHYTIEKVITILMERLKAGGITSDIEVQIAFGGHELAQRKAFEVVINLDYNVVVTNFDPGKWGERYLNIIKGLGEKGYGYPTKAPRDNYKKPYSHASVKPK